MIEVFSLKNHKVVDSFTLYNMIGLKKTHYSRWMKRLRDRGGRDIDWFVSDELLKLNRKIKNRYYFTLDFARAICIQYVTKESNKLIVFLKEEQEKK
jgi:phage anti-repressor protein